MVDGPEDALAVPGRGKAVDMGLRHRAMAAVVQDGMSARAAAARFGLSASSVKRWVKRFRERGHVEPDASGGSALRIEAERDRIVRILEVRPELSSRALGEALAAEGVRFADRPLRRFLKRHRMELSRRLATRRQRKRWKASGGPEAATP